MLRENLWDEENRLRAIDLNPEANIVHPIAIYTYDAGGERVIKQNATSVAIYENALQVGTSIQNDFTLYPSGMLVARPAADGTGALSYTKHYFAGSQRISSKIGTTTNLGKFLQEWTLIENTSGGAPINLVSTSGNQLTTAQTGVTHVYTQFGITPAPTFNSNNAFLPVSSFIGTAAETEAFWFHPDHLGSSNYITNFIGDVSQHMEYFAFGETFVEEHKNSHNSPYKFNGKELDEESGYTYFGARYLDMRYSIWTATDPLSGYNPIFEEEHYIDGQHNGEVYNSFNHNTFGYCYQNPIKYVDPNGKQSYFMAGSTFGEDWDSSYFSKYLYTNSTRLFGSYKYMEWDGSRTPRYIYNQGNKVGNKIISDIKKNFNSNYNSKTKEYTGDILLLGHSNGGNVGRVAAKKVTGYFFSLLMSGKISKMPNINLVTVNTPVQSSDQFEFDSFEKSTINSIGVVGSKFDWIKSGLSQTFLSWDTSKFNSFYDDNDQNVTYDPKNGDEANHMGNWPSNTKEWFPKILPFLKTKVNTSLYQIKDK